MIKVYMRTDWEKSFDKAVEDPVRWDFIPSIASEMTVGF